MKQIDPKHIAIAGISIMWVLLMILLSPIIILIFIVIWAIIAA